MLFKVPGPFYLPLLSFPQTTGVAWMWRGCDACDTWARINTPLQPAGAPLPTPPTPVSPGWGTRKRLRLARLRRPWAPGNARLGPLPTPPPPPRPVGAPLPTPPTPVSPGWGTRMRLRLAQLRRLWAPVNARLGPLPTPPPPVFPGVGDPKAATSGATLRLEVCLRVTANFQILFRMEVARFAFADRSKLKFSK